MQRFNTSKFGFTIIEMIIVVSIIALLVAMAGIAMTIFKKQADDARRDSAMTVISEKLEQYYQDRGEYPSCSDMTDTAASVEALLGLDDGVLKAPLSSDQNSFTCEEIDFSDDQEYYGYLGDGSSECQTGDYCTGYILRYYDEDEGVIASVASRHGTGGVALDLNPVDGLVGWWQLNGNTTDATGNGHTGTINGTVTQTTGQGGDPSTAYSFPGTSGNYISVGSAGGLGAAMTEMTITGWFKFSSTSSEVAILRKEGVFQLGFSNQNTIRNLIATSGGTTGWTASNDISVGFTSGVWYHMAMTWNGTQLRSYINGVQVGSTATVTGTRAASGTAVGISQYRFFPGDIDDVRFYDRALDPEEIETIHDLGAY